MSHRVCETCQQMQPAFGFFGDPHPTRCARCKDEGMVDIVILRTRTVRIPSGRVCNACEQVQANFGFPDDARPTRCARCKEEGMIVLR